MPGVFAPDICPVSTWDLFSYTFGVQAAFHHFTLPEWIRMITNKRVPLVMFVIMLMDTMWLSLSPNPFGVTGSNIVTAYPREARRNHLPQNGVK